MIDIYGISREDLIKWLDENNVKSFKAIQIYEWLYDKKVKTFDEMTNLKKELIEKLKENFYFGKIEIKVKQESKETNKYLFKLEDNNLIEAVLMKHDYGLSVCVSSQIGCNMGCSFCESGRLKKVRDLTSGEIVKQILEIELSLQYMQ
jgi:23S rRNA (adenine2503-C2)-methyltransferase